MKMKIENFKSFHNSERNSSGRVKHSKSVAYIWPKGESVMENLANRRTRPNKEWAILLQAELLKQGVPFKSVHFSQKAGCPCGCSPGFFIKGDYGYEYGYTYHMDVVAE